MTTIAPVKQIEELSKRLDRARQLVAEGKVEAIVGDSNHYVARSDGGGLYMVNGKCTCKDARYRWDTHKGWCKHMLAVELYKESQPQSEPPQSFDRSLEEDIEALFGPREASR